MNDALLSLVFVVLSNTNLIQYDDFTISIDPNIKYTDTVNRNCGEDTRHQHGKTTRPEA